MAKWTDKDIAILKKYYPDIITVQIQQEYRHSHSGIINKVYLLGINTIKKSSLSDIRCSYKEKYNKIILNKINNKLASRRVNQFKGINLMKYKKQEAM